MTFLVSIGLGLVLIPVARAVGLAWGLVDAPGELKIHRSPIPVLGGVAVALSALGAVAVVEGTVPIALAAAVALALATGLLDDVRPLPPVARVVLQAAAGGILVAGGLRLEPAGALGAAAVVALVVATTNAVNILDGQDGLVGGLGVVAALSLGVAATSGGAPGPLSLGVAGALVAFLLWNRPPARIYLGNGGAYAAGVLLAYLAIGAAGDVRTMLAAGACLGVFVFEVTFTVLRRARGRGRISAGDRSHTYDLYARRAGRTRSTLVFWLFGAAAGAVGVAMTMVPVAVGLAVAGTAALAAGTWVVSIRSDRTEMAT